MSNILKSIHKLEDKFDNRAERFAFRHPHAAVLAMFIGLLFLFWQLYLFSLSWLHYRLHCS